MVDPTRNELGQFTTENTGENSPRWKGGKEKWGIALICSGCGVEFRTHRSHYQQSKTKIIYCNRECMKKYSKIEVTCRICKKKKLIYKSDLKIKNRGNYCSKGCARQDAPKGEKSATWKGGRIMDGHGYILIKKPDHPNCNTTGYVKEHRLVMEKYLGRLLEEHEIVHHINGNRQDNYIENLELTTNGEHSTHHNNVRWGNKKPGKIKT